MWDTVGYACGWQYGCCTQRIQPIHIFTVLHITLLLQTFIKMITSDDSASDWVWGPITHPFSGSDPGSSSSYLHSTVLWHGALGKFNLQVCRIVSIMINGIHALRLISHTGKRVWRHAIWPVTIAGTEVTSIWRHSMHAAATATVLLLLSTSLYKGASEHTVEGFASATIS